MRVLVTGATGFLGAHVVRALARRGERVRALVRPGRDRKHVEREGAEIAEGDLLDERSLADACRDVDALIHCAARTGYWSRQNEVQRKVNVEGSSALYRAAQKTRISRIVHVSSVAAVGATRDGTVLDERAIWNLRPLGISYANTKREGEERALAAAWGRVPIVVVNPSMILGPRLDGRPPSSLFARIAAGRLHWTPPGGVSVTDVEDVTAGILAALTHGAVGERYVLAGHNLTWEQLYAAIARATGGRAPSWRMPLAGARFLALATGVLDVLRLARPPWTPEIFRSYGWTSWFDSSKAARELGYHIRPLEEILRHALETPALERASAAQ